MTEEKNNLIQEPNSDDIDALRTVLYKVRGISPVSTVQRQSVADDE